MRVLAGGVERVVLGAHLIMADGDARLHGVRDQPVVDQVELGDMRRAGEGGIHGGLVAQFPFEAEIIRRFLMHGRAAAVERGLHIHHDRQLVEIELHQFRCILGLLEALGDDGDHRIADMAHLAGRENRVLRLLHRLAMHIGDEPAAGHAARAGCVDVLARIDRHDTLARSWPRMCRSSGSSRGRPANAAHSNRVWFGRLMSSVYLPTPLMKRKSSRRFTAAPMPCAVIVSSKPDYSAATARPLICAAAICTALTMLW